MILLVQIYTQNSSQIVLDLEMDIKEKVLVPVSRKMSMNVLRKEPLPWLGYDFFIKNLSASSIEISINIYLCMLFIKLQLNQLTNKDYHHVNYVNYVN